MVWFFWFFQYLFALYPLLLSMSVTSPLFVKCHNLLGKVVLVTLLLSSCRNIIMENLIYCMRRFLLLEKYINMVMTDVMSESHRFCSDNLLEHKTCIKTLLNQSQVLLLNRRLQQKGNLLKIHSAQILQYCIMSIHIQHNSFAHTKSIQLFHQFWPVDTDNKARQLYGQ